MHSEASCQLRDTLETRAGHMQDAHSLTCRQQNDPGVNCSSQQGQRRAWAPGYTVHNTAAKVPGASAAPCAHLPKPDVAIIRRRGKPLP